MTRSRLPPNYVVPAPHPLRSVIAADGELSVVDDAKTIIVGNEAALVFGEIAVDTDAAITLEYSAVEEEDFFIAVALRYEGDEGAFQIKSVEAGELAVPLDLLDSDNFWQVIPPDTAPAAPLQLTITALAEDDGVPMAGTLTVIDRFEPGSNAGARTLATITLSKTFNAP